MHVCLKPAQQRGSNRRKRPKFTKIRPTCFAVLPSGARVADAVVVETAALVRRQTPAAPLAGLAVADVCRVDIGNIVP